MAAALPTGIATAAVPSADRGPSPIAAPVAQESADCIHPSYATDQLVCSDSELRALDHAVVERLEAMPPPADTATYPWIEDQEAWFRRRSLCAFREDHRACVRQAYAMRLAELRARSDSSTRSTMLRCSAWPQTAGYVVAESGLLAVRDNTGVPLVLAWPISRASWTPYATYRWQGRKFLIARQDSNATLTCR